MAYKVKIDTSAYKVMKCSQKNWEPGTLNDFMKAIDGWTIRENNLRELSWRISYLGGWAPHEGSGDNYPIYKAWLEKNDEKKNYVKFWDTICEFERRLPVAMYGFAQGYFDIDKKIAELKKNGVVRIYFKEYYDIRQFKKNMEGCFIEITRV